MSYSGLSLSGKSALVTGSARGIGKSLAIGLAQAGANVAVSDLPSMIEEVKEVQHGYECGIMIENFSDIKENDIIETYEISEEARKL